MKLSRKLVPAYLLAVVFAVTTNGCGGSDGSGGLGSYHFGTGGPPAQPLPTMPLAAFVGTWSGPWATAAPSQPQTGQVTIRFTADGHYTGEITEETTAITTGQTGTLSGTLSGVLVPTGNGTTTQGETDVTATFGGVSNTEGANFGLTPQGHLMGSFLISPSDSVIVDLPKASQ